MSRLCKNCGAPVDLAYCSTCGQKSDVKLLSLAELIGDSLEVIYNVDSRFWRTLLPLLLAPGRLTTEYAAGRRASYLPPFRLYLILSLLFFLALSLGGPDILDEPTATADEVAAELRAAGLTDPQAQEAIQRLADAGVIASDAADQPSVAPAEPSGQDARISTGTRARITLDSPEDCSLIQWNVFLGELLANRARRACEQTVVDNGRALLREFLDKIPILVFICLPMVAAGMKLLYWSPPRRYLEHLTFLFHAHAFFFLLALLSIVALWLVRWISWLQVPLGLLLVAGWVYVPVYLFVALRRVYGQGGLLTLLKFTILGPIYLTCLMATFVGGLLFSLVTI